MLKSLDDVNARAGGRAAEFPGAPWAGGTSNLDQGRVGCPGEVCLLPEAEDCFYITYKVKAM